MYELAFNNNGERFALPSTAEFWRPRRVRERGLEVVYKKDGIVPLIVSIDASAEEFRCEVGNAPGKYRLDALDTHHQPLEGVPAAYVVIPRADAAVPMETAPAATVDKAASRDRAMTETATLLSEVVRVNAEMTRTMAERFSSVLEAAAHLLRAADGAGLPARVPPEPRNAGVPIEEAVDEDAQDEEGDVADKDVFDKIEHVTRNVADAAQALSPVAMMLMGKVALRNAGTKKKAPKHVPTRPPAVPTPPEVPADEPEENVEDTTLTPEVMGHVAAIRTRLDDDEIAFLTSVYAELTPPEVAHWLRELSRLSIDEAVERIRAQIRGAADSEEVLS